MYHNVYLSGSGKPFITTNGFETASYARAVRDPNTRCIGVLKRKAVANA